MSLLSWLSGRKDVTARWTRAANLRLSLDFASGALCGVALGERLERLAFLGPADGGRGPDADLVYRELGLAVGVQRGRIASYDLWWRDSLEQGFQPYAGTVLRDGRPLALGTATTEAGLVLALGEPYWRDHDEEETILFYELKDWRGDFTERQIELDAEGRLTALLVVAQPLLADEAQRRGYGVDRGWPP